MRRLKGLCRFRGLNPKKHRPANSSGKMRTGFYIEKEVLETADELLESRGRPLPERVCYGGIEVLLQLLNSGKAEDYLLRSLSSVLTGTESGKAE